MPPSHPGFGGISASGGRIAADAEAFFALCIDKTEKTVYYNYRYITIVIIEGRDAVYAAQDKDNEGHDPECSH